MAGTEVVVIGGGIVGASVADRLTERGARVTLVDAGRPSAGTSAASFAWLNSFNKAPRAYHELNVAGIAEHRALAGEFGRAPWLHLSGGFQWATTPAGREELRRHAARLRDWGYPVEAVAPERVTRELEPGLALDAGAVEEIWYTPDEGWVDAPLLVERLVVRARERGAVTRAASPVTAIARASGRIGGVTLADGTVLRADAVVDCAGPRAAEVAALAGVALPVERVPGLLAVTAPLARPLSHVCHAPDVALRPDPTGGVVLGHATTLDQTVTAETPPVPPPPACAELLARAGRALPAVTRAGVAAARIGVRPVPVDGLTIAGAAPGLAGFYVAVTHSGITLGPLLGRLLAEELVTGMPPARLAPFRPDRFVVEHPLQ